MESSSVRHDQRHTLIGSTEVIATCPMIVRLTDVQQEQSSRRCLRKSNVAHRKGRWRGGSGRGEGGRVEGWAGPHGGRAGGGTDRQMYRPRAGR